MAKDGGLTAPPIVEDDFGDQKDGENNENGKIDIVHLKKRLEETQQLREIKGYYVNGIVKNVNNPDEIDAVLLISNTGQKYYAREGEIIKGTLITVKEINSGNVIISKPGFKDTEIPFKMERLLQKWKNN
jgi:hypothetical protein